MTLVFMYIYDAMCLCLLGGHVTSLPYVPPTHACKSRINRNYRWRYRNVLKILKSNIFLFTISRIDCLAADEFRAEFRLVYRHPYGGIWNNLNNTQ